MGINNNQGVGLKRPAERKETTGEEKYFDRSFDSKHRNPKLMECYFLSAKEKNYQAHCSSLSPRTSAERIGKSCSSGENSEGRNEKEMNMYLNQIQHSQ